MVQEQRKFVGIQVGDNFSCYDDLKATIDQVQSKTGVLLYMRDCVTLKGAMKKRPNVATMANPDLMYHSIQYICVFGKRRAAKGTKGLLPQMLSKDGDKCKAEIRIGLSEDFQLLRVKKIIDTHNHVISKEMYNLIAQNRTFEFTPRHQFSSRRNSVKKSQAVSAQSSRKRLLTGDDWCSGVRSHSIDKPVVNDAIAETSKQLPLKRKKPEASKQSATKKIKIVREIHMPSHLYGGPRHSDKCINAAAKNRSKLSKRSGFKRVLEEMYLVDGATVEVYEEGIKPQGIFFQTEEMRNNFASYSELFLIDASYKVHDLGMTVCVISNTDGNGECTITGFSFLMKESARNFEFALNMFKKHNPNCNEVKAVLLDVDFPKKDVLMSKFPKAATFIPYHHAIRAFEREAYTEVDIGFQDEEERDTCMKLFKKMALAKDKDTYSFHFERFKLYSPSPLFNYFLATWHKTPDKWVDGLKHPNAIFLNQRHSRFDAINQILKSVCENFKTVPHFFHDLMKSVNTLQLERKQRALFVPVKGPVITSEFHIAEMQYRNLLTKYAFNFVKKQLHSSTNVTIAKSMSDGHCHVKSARLGELLTSSNSCQCTFHLVTGLPCAHIFAVRKDKGFPTYEASLCNKRWTLHFLRRTHNLPGADSDLVPDALFGYGETFEGASPILEEVFSAVSSTPFVPSSASSDTLMNNQDFEDDSVIGEGVDTDFLLPLQLEKSTRRNDGKGDDIPDIDWVGLLETL